MRMAAALGLIFALVIGLLALTQVSDLQARVVAVTSGPLQDLSGSLSFFWLLAVVAVAVIGLSALIFVAFRNL